MTKAELVSFMRTSVNVQDPTGVSNDPAFLALTDTQLESILTLSLIKESPSSTLNNIPNELLFPVVLTSKKELYHQLAVKSAPFYKMSASGASLQKSDRFDHYYRLITEVETEYQNYLKDSTTLTSVNVVRKNNYYTNRNYNLASRPEVELSLDTAYSDRAELSWEVNRCDRFYNFLLYQSSSAIVDVYGTEIVSINSSAVLISTIVDIHTLTYRLLSLLPNTRYFVALIIQERNGLKGYSEIDFTTNLA